MNQTDPVSKKTSTDLANEALQQSQSPANPADEVAESDSLAETLQSLQNLIERNANRLEEINTAIREKRESLKNIFENDSALQEVVAQVDVMAQQAKERKSVLNNSPEATSVKVHIAELAQEKKEYEEALSNHLINYYTITNSRSFDTSSGDQWEFDIRAKVKGKPRD